jgi:hypothetical protein
MPNVTTYVMLMFGISIAFFLAGQPPLFFSFLNCVSTGNAETDALACNPGNLGLNFINLLATGIGNPATLIVFGFATIMTIITRGTSFGAIYLFPIAMILLLQNLFVTPAAFFGSNAFGMPAILGAIIIGFFNLLLLLTILNFIKGTD